MKHGTKKVSSRSVCRILWACNVYCCIEEGIDIVCLPDKTHWAPMPHREKKEWKQLWLDF
jgi:hypothetical protein